MNEGEPVSWLPVAISLDKNNLHLSVDLRDEELFTFVCLSLPPCLTRYTDIENPHFLYSGMHESCKTIIMPGSKFPPNLPHLGRKNHRFRTPPRIITLPV